MRTPDEMSVPGMAAGRREAIGDLPRPRVLVRPSMGEMVSLATARHVEVDAMVLIAAGFGIEVSDRLFDWVKRNPPGIVADFNARGHARQIRQSQASAAYQPEPLHDPRPTLALWGVQDSAVASSITFASRSSVAGRWSRARTPQTSLSTSSPA